MRDFGLSLHLQHARDCNTCLSPHARLPLHGEAIPRTLHYTTLTAIDSPATTAPVKQPSGQRDRQRNRRDFPTLNNRHKAVALKQHLPAVAVNRITFKMPNNSQVIYFPKLHLGPLTFWPIVHQAPVGL